MVETGAKDISINSPDGDDACPSVLNISFLGVRGLNFLYTFHAKVRYAFFIAPVKKCPHDPYIAAHAVLSKPRSPHGNDHFI